MTRLAILALAGVLFLSSCGFHPLYAENEGGGGLRRMALVDVTAPDAIAPTIRQAFKRRTALGDEAPYELSISATEQSERLAVQRDSTVTRFNYQLRGSYFLTERATGKRYTGRVVSSASFNVVNSQYSTLFAEEAAKEKAATQLVDDVERQILLELADENEGK
ncbi:MAG: hypothetical protein R3C60_10680 [Parvularculaceae bacterium]